MKRRTTEEWVKIATERHGGKYDYSSVVYVNNNTPVKISCPIHGPFEQTPKMHVIGFGCPMCARSFVGKNNLVGQGEFLKRCREKHGDRYDYSKTIYRGFEEEIIVTCKKHGDFTTTPHKFLTSCGCMQCYSEERGKKKRYTNEQFIYLCKKKHGDKYNYAKVNYVKSNEDVTLTCKKHGDFTVKGLAALNYNGILCQKCREEERAKIAIEKKEAYEAREKEKEIKRNEILKKTKEYFFAKSKSVHNGFYDYSKTEFTNYKDKVCITCPTHGDFWQLPSNHMNGHGCPMCGKIKVADKLKHTREVFIENARKVHGDKYDYSKVEYINNSTKVCIICPKHGEFWQTPGMHFNEHQGCPNCSTLSSNDENEIFELLKNETPFEVVKRDKTLIGPKEIDILIPEKQIGIEFDGLRLHSEEFGKDKWYHYNKTKLCKEKGIGLIHVFEDEWLFKKDIVKHKILHILGVDKCLPKIMGRKCRIAEIKAKEASLFLEKYHIQGFSRGSVHLGAFYEDNLIGVMTFLRDRDKWILSRFATDYNYVCQGVGGKLLAYFISNYSPLIIETFADKRWTIDKDNNFYTKSGFYFDVELPPQYSYVTSKNSFKKRYHKFNFRKKILHKKHGLPMSMTESEMVKELGYCKIWDCGLYKYVWKP